MDMEQLEALYGSPATPVTQVTQLFTQLQQSLGPALMTDMALLLELSCARDLVAFVREVAGQDLRRLIDGAEEHTDEFVRSGTLAEFLQVAPALQKLLPCEGGSLEDLLVVLADAMPGVANQEQQQQQGGVGGSSSSSGSRWSGKLQLCNEHVHALKHLYSSLANRSEVTRQVVRGLMEEGVVRLRVRGQQLRGCDLHKVVCRGGRGTAGGVLGSRGQEPPAATTAKAAARAETGAAAAGTQVGQQEEEEGDAQGEGVRMDVERRVVVSEQGADSNIGRVTSTAAGTAAAPGNGGGEGSSSGGSGSARWYSWLELEELKSRVHLLMTSHAATAAFSSAAGGCASSSSSGSADDELTPAVMQQFVGIVDGVGRVVKLFGELTEAGHLHYEDKELQLPPGENMGQGDWLQRNIGKDN